MITEYDHLPIRCPKLGHKLNFHYCRTGDSGEPCRRILHCWSERLSIKEFMQEHYGDETMAAITAPPKDKVYSLLELIQQAQENAKKAKERKAAGDG